MSEWLLFACGVGVFLMLILDTHVHTNRAQTHVHTQVNQVLPIGGPGKAYTAREQADILFRLTGKKQVRFMIYVMLKYVCVSFGASVS